MAGKETNLKGVIEWFESAVIPQRTAFAGLSPNRFWKSPRAWIAGNVEDPNGLCGDTSAWVHEQFHAKFNGYTTNDGYQIGMILWVGSSGMNHMANVMRLKAKSTKQEYRYSETTRQIVIVEPKVFAADSHYLTAEFLRLKVLDLYYKKHTNLNQWWADLDSLGDTVTIGGWHHFSD